MLPRQLKEIMEYLLKCGYSRYLVEKMDRRHLLICFRREKEIRSQKKYKEDLRKLANLKKAFYQFGQAQLIQKK